MVQLHTKFKLVLLVDGLGLIMIYKGILVHLDHKKRIEGMIKINSQHGMDRVILFPKTIWSLVEHLLLIRFLLEIM